MSDLCDSLSEEGVMQAEGVIWFADVHYAADYANNPLEEYDSVGVIHANFSSSHGYGRSEGVGDKKEFESAVGGLYKIDEDAVQVSDESYYREEADEEVILMASRLVLLEASREQMAQWFGQLLEDGVEIEFEEGESPDDYLVQLQFFLDEAGDSWTTDFGSAETMPAGLWPDIMSRAQALAEKQVEARVVGDEYAVMLNYRDHGNYGADANVCTPSSSLSQSGWSSHNKSDGIWIPDDETRKQLEALPYYKAMALAFESAKHATELFSSWANGEVYRYDVKVYELLYDEDGEPLTDRSEYEDSEPLHEDSCGDYYGDDELKGGLSDAKAYCIKKAIETLQAQRSEVQPDLFVSAPSTSSGGMGM